jgi:hypothetical protein
VLLLAGYLVARVGISYPIMLIRIRLNATSNAISRLPELGSARIGDTAKAELSAAEGLLCPAKGKQRR